MKIRQFVAAGLIVVFLSSCAGMTTREQRVLSGGAIGAGLGTATAAIVQGSLFTGAAIGAAAGAIGGLIYDETQKRRR
jgi:hypothetical protein